MDLSEVVVQALDFQPAGVRRDHAPGHQIIERRAPQHRLLAAGIHGDVAADGAGILRGGIDGETQALRFGAFRDLQGDDTGLGAYRGYRFGDTFEFAQFDGTECIELLGVDDRGVLVERHGAAGVAGAAAARDNGESKVDAGRDHVAHLGLAVRGDDDQRKLHAPVGGIGDMRDPRQPAEIDIVTVRDARQTLTHRAALLLLARKSGLELGDRRARARHQLQGQRVVVGARLDLGEAMVQGADQQLAPVAVFEQVVLDVGIADDDPHVPQHLEQHARTASGAARAAQTVEHVPHLFPEEPDDDLAVGEGGVIVRDFADTHGKTGRTATLDRGQIVARHAPGSVVKE